jgi:hypothetical protein
MIFETGAVMAAIGFGGSALKALFTPKTKVRATINRVIRDSDISHKTTVIRDKGTRTITKYAKVRNIYQEKYGFLATIPLFGDITKSDFEKKKEVFETQLGCPVKFDNEGKILFIEVLTAKLPKGIKYNDTFADADKKYDLAIPLGYSRKGIVTWDLGVDAFSHLLGGGPTRMGKSNLLKLIITHIISRHSNQAEVYFFSPRKADSHVFQGLRGVTVLHKMKESIMALLGVANRIVPERDELFTQKRVANIIEYNRIPGIKKIKHIFLVIDEYANYCDEDDFVDVVKTVAEQGGYAGVHLILFTQRPDANEVLNPRIKTNLMAKIAIGASTTSNSKIILDVEEPDASKLPKVKGRAILKLDDYMEIQIPEITREQMEKLLQPYRRDESVLDGQIQSHSAGLRDVASHEPGSDSDDPLPSH